MDLLTSEETARRLRVSYWTLANWRRADWPHPAPELPYVKVGHRVMYQAADVDRFIARHTVAA